jgi:hypothetical protein
MTLCTGTGVDLLSVEIEQSPYPYIGPVVLLHFYDVAHAEVMCLPSRFSMHLLRQACEYALTGVGVARRTLTGGWR